MHLILVITAGNRKVGVVARSKKSGSSSVLLCQEGGTMGVWTYPLTEASSWSRDAFAIFVCKLVLGRCGEEKVEGQGEIEGDNVGCAGHKFLGPCCRWKARGEESKRGRRGRNEQRRHSILGVNVRLR